MAQYEAQCSAVGSFGYAQNFKLYVILTDGEVSGNYSKVNYNVYCEADGSGSIDATHWKYFRLNGEEIYNVTEKVTVSSPDAYIHIASGTSDWIEHEPDGTKTVEFSAQIKANSYGVEAGIVGGFELTPIAREFTSAPTISVKSKTLTSITVDWSTSEPCDRIDYNINGTVATYAWTGSATKGTITFNNLKPNTSYSIYLWCRREDSQLGMVSSTIYETTHDIARISTANDFNLGNEATVTYSNPSGASLEAGIYSTDGNTEYAAYRSCSGDSYTFTFTDAELDSIYKALGVANSKEFKVSIRTAGIESYTDNKNITITLTGNQKTRHVNVNGEWKRAKRWIKVDGEWRRCVRWINVDGTWRRCI